MKKSIQVNIDGRKVEVSKLPLGKYAELLKAVKELPKHADRFKNLESNQVLMIMPEIIGESLPDFINILSIATPLTAEEIEQLGLDDAVKLTMAVIEVNNYQEVYNSLKKATARQPQEK